jgi:putative effector of murein hydrolase
MAGHATRSGCGSQSAAILSTARAFTESEVAGSFAGLGMTLNAVLTAMVVPPIVHFLGFG